MYLIVLRAANAGESGLAWGEPLADEATAKSEAAWMNADWPGEYPVFFVTEVA